MQKVARPAEISTKVAVVNYLFILYKKTKKYRFSCLIDKTTTGFAYRDLLTSKYLSMYLRHRCVL